MRIGSINSLIKCVPRFRARPRMRNSEWRRLSLLTILRLLCLGCLRKRINWRTKLLRGVAVRSLNTSSSTIFFTPVGIFILWLSTLTLLTIFNWTKKTMTWELSILSYRLLRNIRRQQSTRSLSRTSRLRDRS